MPGGRTVVVERARAEREVRAARDGERRFLACGARCGEGGVFRALLGDAGDGREVAEGLVEHSVAGRYQATEATP